MLSLNHKLACRNCMRTTGIDYRYRLNSQEQEKYQSKSEYELMLRIEQWRATDGLCCDFCSSKNIEVSEIDVDGHQLYQFSKLRLKAQAEGSHLLYMTYDKSPNNSNLNVWESSNMSWPFLAEATFQTRNLFDCREDSTFKSHPNGFFFICMSMEPELSNIDNTCTVHRLSYAGVTKKEVLSVIEDFEEEKSKPFRLF